VHVSEEAGTSRSAAVTTSEYNRIPEIIIVASLYFDDGVSLLFVVRCSFAGCKSVPVAKGMDGQLRSVEKWCVSCKDGSNKLRRKEERSISK